MKKFFSMLLFLCMTITALMLCVGAETDTAAYTESYYVALADWCVEVDIADDGAYIITLSDLFDLRTMQRAEPIQVVAETYQDAVIFNSTYPGDVLHLSADGKLSVSSLSPAEAANALVDDDDSRVFDLSGMDFVDGESITIPGVTEAETATQIHIRVITLGRVELNDYNGSRAIVVDAAVGETYGNASVMEEFTGGQTYYYYPLSVGGCVEISEPTPDVFDNFINDMNGKTILIPALDAEYGDYADLSEFESSADYVEETVDISAYGVYNSAAGTLDMTVLILGPVVHGHRFPAEWTVKTEPTLFQTGLAYRKCSTCGEIVWKTLPVKDVDVSIDENYEICTITVVDVDTQEPVAGALVSLNTVSDGACKFTTDAAGQATRTLPVGEHTAVIEKEGYVSQETTLSVVRGQQDLGQILLQSTALRQGNAFEGTITAFTVSASDGDFGTVTFAASDGSNVSILAADLGITMQTPKVTYLGLPMTLYVDCAAEEFGAKYDVDPDKTSAHILTYEPPLYVTVENLGDAGSIRYFADSDTLEIDGAAYSSESYEWRVYTFGSDGWSLSGTGMSDLCSNFAFDERDGYIGSNSYGKIDYRVVHNDTAEADGDAVKDVLEILYTPYAFGRYYSRTLRYIVTGLNENFATMGTYESVSYKNLDKEETHFVEYLLGAKSKNLAKVSDSTASASRSAGEKAMSVTLEGVSAASGDFVFYSYNALDNILTVAQNCGSFREGRLTGCNYINYTVRIDGTDKMFGFNGAFYDGTFPIPFEDYDFDALIIALRAGKNNVQYIEADGCVVYIEEYLYKYRFDYAVVTVDPAVLAELLGMTEEEYGASLTGGLHINSDGYVSIAVLDKTSGKWRLASLKDFHYGEFDKYDGTFESQKDVALLAKYYEIVDDALVDADLIREIAAALEDNAVFLVIDAQDGVYDLAGNVGNVDVYNSAYFAFGEETSGIVFSDVIPKTSPLTADPDVDPKRVPINCDTVVAVIDGTQVAARVGVQKSKDAIMIFSGTAKILSADSSLIVMDATGCTLADINGNSFDMTRWSAEPFILHEFSVTAEAIPAACETEGKTAVETCANCGAVRGGEAIPARGHSFGEWVVTKEATAGSEGEQTHICTVCGAEESETIPRIALGDVDGDGVLTIRDTLMTLRTMLNGSAYNATMDMNGDGKISLLDVLLLLKSIRA